LLGVGIYVSFRGYKGYRLRFIWVISYRFRVIGVGDFRDKGLYVLYVLGVKWGQGYKGYGLQG
jgi:hypothetical protein